MSLTLNLNECTTADTNELLNTFQSQNLKRKIDLLEQKLAICEKESQKKIENFAGKISALNESEIKLRGLILSKDRSIHELSLELKKKDNDLLVLRKIICEKEENMNEVLGQLSIIKSNCDLIKENLNSKEKQELKLNSEINSLKLEKEKLEDRLKDMLTVLNEYGTQVEETTEKLQKKEIEIYENKTKNMALESEKKNLITENQDFKNKIIDFEKNINDYESYIQKINRDNEDIKKENEEYNKKNTNLNSRIDDLTKENKKLEQFINDLTYQKNKIASDLELNIKTNQKNNEIVNKFNSDYNNLINDVNENINTILTWLDRNLLNCITEHKIYYDIPNFDELNLTITYSNRINFGQIKEKLMTIGRKLLEDYSKKITETQLECHKEINKMKTIMNESENSLKTERFSSNKKYDELYNNLKIFCGNIKKKMERIEQKIKVNMNINTNDNNSNNNVNINVSNNNNYNTIPNNYKSEDYLTEDQPQTFYNYKNFAYDKINSNNKLSTINCETKNTTMRSYFNDNNNDNLQGKAMNESEINNNSKVSNIEQSYNNLNNENSIVILEEIFEKLYENCIDLFENYNKLSFENESLKKELNEKNHDINKFSESMKILETKITENNIVEKDIQNMNSINKILEKKVKNLETDLELKAFQIKSLEEIIKRKENEKLDNSLKYSTDESNNEGSCLDKNKNYVEIISKLEKDREKLIKDNMILIQENKNLQQKIIEIQNYNNTGNNNSNYN